jgi:hypothetical protein
MSQATLEFIVQEIEAAKTGKWDLQENRSHRPLLEMLRNLDPDERVRLVALVWTNRGLYQTHEWKKALKDAADAYGASSTENPFGLGDRNPVPDE